MIDEKMLDLQKSRMTINSTYKSRGINSLCSRNSILLHVILKESDLNLTIDLLRSHVKIYEANPNIRNSVSTENNIYSIDQIFDTSKDTCNFFNFICSVTSFG